MFLSYAREDQPAVQAIHDALQIAGIDVWFDHVKLEEGEAWEHTIKRRIRSCILFLPVISRRHGRSLEGVFRHEWNLALQRAQRIDKSVTFIIPVAIDDIKASAARVPDEFRAWHWAQDRSNRHRPGVHPADRSVGAGIAQGQIMELDE